VATSYLTYLGHWSAGRVLAAESGSYVRQVRNPRRDMGIGRRTGAVGINLWEAPSSDEHGGPVPAGEDSNKPILLIGVYQRSNAMLRCGEENFYDTGWRGVTNGGSSNYAQGRLTVSNPGRFGSAVTIDLDLRFDPVRDVWTGRFHRGTFDKFLTLRRAPNRDDYDGGICPMSGPNPLAR
jgi:hypothetical protein